MTYQDIIAHWIIVMSFIGNIVEIWKFFRQLGLILSLFKDILLLIPAPWLVDLSKIFND